MSTSAPWEYVHINCCTQHKVPCTDIPKLCSSELPPPQPSSTDVQEPQHVPRPRHHHLPLPCRRPCHIHPGATKAPLGSLSHRNIIHAAKFIILNELQRQLSNSEETVDELKTRIQGLEAEIDGVRVAQEADRHTLERERQAWSISEQNYKASIAGISDELHKVSCTLVQQTPSPTRSTSCTTHGAFVCCS